MAKVLQLRRGTTAQHSTFTGAVGELTIDTDKDVAVVHDGATAGGFPLVKQSSIYGFKNYIINGGFDVWQRGTSQTTSGYGSADRWFFGWTSGSLSVIKGQDVSPSPYSQFGNYALLGGTSLVGGYSMHKIESVRTCSGKTVTLSYCYITVSGTNTFLSNCYLRQDFGTGGSSNVDTAAVADTTTSIGTNQYRRVLTFNIPSISGKTIGTNDNLSVVNGYAGTFQQAVWGFQLEEGSVATPFENRPIGLELSLCQRYYYFFGNFDALYRIRPATSLTTIPFPTSMRTDPSITYRLQKDGIDQPANSGTTILQVNNAGVFFNVDTGYVNFTDVMYFTADAEL